MRSYQVVVIDYRARTETTIERPDPVGASRVLQEELGHLEKLGFTVGKHPEGHYCAWLNWCRVDLALWIETVETNSRN